MGILFVRIFLFIYVVIFDGCIVQIIVKWDLRSFLFRLIQWFLIVILVTFINSFIRFLESKFGLVFRICLVNYVYEQYFFDQIYYRVSNLDSRLFNVDQCFIDDISMFTQFFVYLYFYLTKFMLDVAFIFFILYFFVLSRGVSFKWLIIIVIIVIFIIV